MNHAKEFDCLIPCAGLSERMGEWKPMLAYKGKPLIMTAVENALQACRRVILVTGHRGKELEELFSQDTRIVTIRNSGYRRGMFSSIQVGTRLVDSDKFFVMLGDMPAIPVELFGTLAEQADRYPEKAIVRPVYMGKPGHPVLLERKVRGTIQGLPHDANMQRVFQVHEETHGRGVYNVAVDTPGCVYDIDTYDDLKR